MIENEQNASVEDKNEPENLMPKETFEKLPDGQQQAGGAYKSSAELDNQRDEHGHFSPNGESDKTLGSEVK